ncbi:MAG: GH92 family glycosyl hydrolase [Janthinobacterium lividum]
MARLLRSLAALVLLPALLPAQRKSPADSVNPLVGTANEGNTFPGVGVPFGMTAWTPATASTEKKGVIPYIYKAGRIVGFRGSHFLSGSATQDYGSFQIMAGSGNFSQAEAARGSSFSHTDEHAHPYRYDVVLPESRVRASVTATARCGLLSFTFDHAGTAWAQVQNLARGGDGTLAVDAAHHEITGTNPVRRIYLGNGKLAGFSGYVVVQFDHDFTPGESWRSNGMGAGAPLSMETEAAARRNGKAIEFEPSGTAITFQVKQGETVHARIGTSFVSVEEARRNLKAEISTWDAAAIEKQSHAAWDRELGRIEVEGPEADRRVFYTSLYHAFQLPRVVSDVSGTRPKFASGTPVQGSGDYYDDFSAWDTFRASHPLLTILDPQRDAAMIRSLILKGDEGGFLPIFPAWSSYTSEMIGDHTTAIIGDAYLKGIRGFDIAKAYTLMRRNAFDQPATVEEYKDGRGRRALEDYLKLGYIPLENGVPDAFHQKEQVSRTLEYAYDDFVLGRVAKSLGHNDDADTLMKRAENYRNVIDPETKLARGRHADGTWITPFDPGKPATYITEGLPFQYTFFVPQDLPGLIASLGGTSGFLARLDELFAKGYYDHGNEPSHAITYLFDYAGEAWKTQQHVADIRSKWYLDAPDGLAGNDDAGQMSAWYIFSALGFYPVTPGIPAYELGTPLLPSATLHLDGGKTFRVRAEHAGSANPYIQSATLNGKPLERFWIRHSEILAGGELVFRMGPQPNKSWPRDTVLPN